MAQMGPLPISICMTLAATYHEACGDSGLTANEALEEWLLAEIFVVLLEVLLGCGYELDGDELVSAIESVSDGAVFR